MFRFIGLGLLGVGLAVGLPAETAQAHDGFYGGGFYGGGFGGYYGNGGHDVVPHWHDTHTPYGSYSWYGTGTHDYLPHHHTYSPWSYQGHHYSPWGYTRSYYPRYPQYYSHW